MRISDWSSDVCSSDLFVMDLEQHPHLRQPGVGERGRHPHHRALDDIGAGALDRGVDRRTLGALAFVLDLGLDARKVRLAAEQRLGRSEEHTSELQSLMRISYAVFCLKKTTSTTHMQPQVQDHTL